MSEVTDNTPKRRRTKVLVVAVALLAIAGAAFAYWTSTGSGTGEAATGDSSPITINQTSTLTALVPGKAAQELEGDFTNTDNDGPVYITNVVVSIDSVDKATGAPAGTCAASDYTLTGATMTVGADVPAGTNVGSWGGAMIAFKNLATNQNACKGATVNLAYTAS